MTFEYGYTNDHELYVRPIANDAPWTCVICEISEDTIYIDEWQGTHVWFRYGLKCEHQAHDVCYRKWSEKSGKIGCPRCGPLDKVNAYQFCLRCHMFGHPLCHDEKK